MVFYLTFLLLFLFSVDGYEFVDGYGEQGRKKDNAEGQKGFQDYVALFDDTPDRQYGDRCTGDDANEAYDKTDEVYRT